jgi:hypothetical protein
MMGKYKRSDFINADDFIASLPADVRAAGEARAKVLIAEELTLRELRQALELTQAQVGRHAVVDAS